MKKKLGVSHDITLHPLITPSTGNGPSYKINMVEIIRLTKMKNLHYHPGHKTPRWRLEPARGSVCVPVQDRLPDRWADGEFKYHTLQMF